MGLSDKNLVSLVAAEHIGPTETGDNIDAKRVAVYFWNGSSWERSMGGTPQPSTPTVTSVDDSTSSVTIIAANSSRKEVEFQNTSSGNLFLRKGTTAATTASGGYTVKIPQDGYYRTDYTGAFRGIWDADAGGSVTITEST